MKSLGVFQVLFLKNEKKPFVCQLVILSHICLFRTTQLTSAMKFSLLPAIVTAGAVCAEYQAFKPRAGQPLLPRDFGDGDCVIGSTCTECFGAGYIICDKIGCFNPGEHQQCCKDAGLYNCNLLQPSLKLVTDNKPAICVGSTNACCQDYVCSLLY